MIEHSLRERLSTRRLPEITVEAKRLHGREIRFHGEHRRAHALFLREYLPSPLVQHRIDAADDITGALDFDEEHGLLDTRRRE